MIATPSAQSILPRSALAIAGAALLWAGLAACSSSGGTTPASTHNAQPGAARTSVPSGAPAAGSSAAACGLVTASEVTTATGKPMAAGNGAGNICSYSATADPSLVVYVQIYPDVPSMATPKLAESGSEQLHGLGDDAFWTAAGSVFVQKGSRGFSITIPSLTLTSRNAPPAIVALATAALARL